MDQDAVARYFMIFLNPIPGKETFVMQVDKPDEHFTLQIRHGDREWDFHKTNVLPGGAKEYETLFKISFYSIARLLVILRKEGKRLEQEIQTLEDFQRELGIEFRNPGWFRRHFMEAMGGDPNKLAELPFLRTKNKGRQVRFAKDFASIDPDAIFRPIDAQLEPGLHQVLRWNKGGSASYVGALAVLPAGPRHILWIPKKVTDKIQRRIAKIFLAELKRMKGPGVDEFANAIRKTYPRMELVAV